jgi:hypothetical protein
MKKIIGIHITWWNKELSLGEGLVLGKWHYDTQKDYSDYLKSKKK